MLLSQNCTGGVDYNSGPYTVMFTAGQTRASFDLDINIDNTLEADEDFVITIDPSSLADNFVVGDRRSATVTIEDDEGEWFCCIVLCKRPSNLLLDMMLQ